jgi:hypothetical protein
VLAFVALLPACADTTFSPRHSPAYRAEAHTSTISVTARSASGIQRIDLDVLVGDLVACTNEAGLPSMFPCRRDGYWTTYHCYFDPPPLVPIGGDPGIEPPPEVALAFPPEATCSIDRTLNALSLVTYRATALDASGSARSSSYFTYSGGAPPVAFPTATLGPSFADVLRPVWLEMGDASLPTDDMAGKIDVMFLPEDDWFPLPEPSYHGFAASVADIARRLVFEPDNGNQISPVVEDYFMQKELFNYWVGPIGTDVVRVTDPYACDIYPRDWVPAARAVTDVQAVVHKLHFEDCSRIDQRWGTVFAEPNAILTYVHESGHFIFKMGDEHPRAVSPAESDPPNNFATQAACEQTASAYGYPLAWCVPIDGWEHPNRLWRITGGMAFPEIMDKNSVPPDFDSDWQDTNDIVFHRQMAACRGGICW